MEDLRKEQLLQREKGIYPKTGGVPDSQGKSTNYIKLQSGTLKLFFCFEQCFVNGEGVKLMMV